MEWWSLGRKYIIKNAFRVRNGHYCILTYSDAFSLTMNYTYIYQINIKWRHCIKIMTTVWRTIQIEHFEQVADTCVRYLDTSSIRNPEPFFHLNCNILLINMKYEPSAFTNFHVMCIDYLEVLCVQSEDV